MGRFRPESRLPGRKALAFQYDFRTPSHTQAERDPAAAVEVAANAVGRACLWRRTARRQPRGFCQGVLFVEVSENLLDHQWVFDATDDPERATASQTGLDVRVA